MPLVTAAVAEVVAVDSKHLTRNALFGLAALREVGALTCMSPSEWLSDLILIDHATKRDNPLGYLDRGSYPGRNFSSGGLWRLSRPVERRVEGHAVSEH